MNDIPILSLQDCPAWLERARRPFHAAYYAMYSSVFGGLVTDPLLMLVPMDDHGVHRGDGVFETIKCHRNRIYALPAHLDRLANSARQLGMKLPWTQAELTALVIKTVKTGGHADCLVRILLTRGPGSMGVSPYDCPAPQLYILAYELSPPFMAKHPRGARVITSRIPVKPSYFANVKSCNYLQNAMMKKEAADAGADFALAFDEKGFLAEGATENAGIVTKNALLCVPKTGRILAGTTMMRALELAQRLVTQGLLGGTMMRDISKLDLADAREILIFGTTPDVTAATSYDNRPVGLGIPGQIQRTLNELLQEDIEKNESMQTRVE